MAIMGARPAQFSSRVFTAIKSYCLKGGGGKQAWVGLERLLEQRKSKSKILPFKTTETLKISQQITIFAGV